MVAPALLMLFACAGLPPGDPNTPDVVLVSIDTLRADHVSSYGYSRQTTPFVDSLAARGARFANARSTEPWTLPAHTTLMTGRGPESHRVVEDDISPGSDLPMLAEVFQSAGYATGGVVSTFYVSRRYGFDRGFDAFDDFGIADPKTNLAKGVPAEEVANAGLRFLRDLPREKPAFLFLHFYDAHYEYKPPAPYATLFDRAPRKKDPRYKNYAWYIRHPVPQAALDHQVAQYDEAIRYVDDQMARLGEAMEKAGRQVNWVVTSDHGEEFGERGSWGHGHTLYPEQLQVPLVMAGPRVGTVVVPDAVGLQDIGPTLAAWAGGSLPGATGLDLGSALQGQPLPERPFLAETSRFKSNRLSLFQGGWRLDMDLAHNQETLFHTAADPGEKVDLAGGEPDRLATLRGLLFQALGEPWTATRTVSLGAEGAARLVRGAVIGKDLDLVAGDSFQVLPLDGRFQERGRDRRWRGVGQDLPTEGDPVRMAGGRGGDVSLSEEDREQLEKLGYVE